MTLDSSSSQPIDARQREQALTMGESFCVTAPAGSGKTELLTRRVLKLLAHCKEPEEVLCITFTRKAASEMKTRIMDTLLKGEDPQEPDNEYDKEQWQLARDAYCHNEKNNWQLLENPNRLRILTIDSFCHSLTRQLPLLSRMGASVAVCEDPEEYYQQASRNLLASIEKDGDAAEALIIVLEHLDNNVAKIEALFVTMLRKRDQWLPHTGHNIQSKEIRLLLESWLQEVIEEHLQRNHKLLIQHEDEIVELANYATENLARKDEDHLLLSCMGLKGLPGTSFENLEQWLGISDLLLTQTGTFRKQITVKNGFDSGGKGDEKLLRKEKKLQHKALIASLNDNIADELALIKILPSPHYDDLQWEVLGALNTSLTYLAAHLHLVFQERGEVDYPEVMAASLKALGDETEPTDLALLLDQQINHILIDEFQDTSILQSRLIEQLTSTWLPDDPRTLFIVGDGMQSIYKFRNANVGLFLKARNSGIGELPLTSLSLSVNFRSTATVIDWVNNNFSKAFPQQENISLGAITYSASEPFSKGDVSNEEKVSELSEVQCYAFTGLDGNENDTSSQRQQEARQVLSLVEQTLKNRPGDTIGILVRTRNHLSDILPVLNEAGIRWQANELDSLSNNQVIQDLLILTQAVNQLSDRTAWLALLRTPFCGLNLEDLHTLSIFKGNSTSQISIWQAILNFETIEHLSNDAKSRLNKIRNTLQAALNDKYRKPVRSWIEGTWIALGGPLVGDKNELNDVNAFFQLLDKLENAGQVDVNALAVSIDKLYAQTDASAPATIQVMTIHKSKGLEFDTVILPGLDRRPRSDDTPILRWYERINEQGLDRLIMAPITGPGKDANNIFDYIKYEENRKTVLETTRLLYVACTRAKSHLYLTASIDADAEDDSNNKGNSRFNEDRILRENLKSPASSSLLSSIWPEFQEHCIINPELTNPEPETIPIATILSTNIKTTQYKKIKSSWNLPKLPEGQLLKSYRGQELLKDIENRPDIDLNTIDKHIGTVAHEALYTISKTSLEQFKQNWQVNQLEQYLPLWKNRLMQLGINDQAAEKGSEKILLLIANTLQCDSGMWILKSTHLQAESELPITVNDQGEARDYIIDRTFVDENNVRWIIDYKTSSPSGDEDIEIFLAREKEKYQQQLTGYSEAFIKLDSKAIKVALYFPALSFLQQFV